ncbi:MAG: Bax inhibitor-1 family protein [Planctomycetota bacterium]
MRNTGGLSFPEEFAADSFTYADRASVDARADFISKTYMHLAGAILAFVLLEAVILNTPPLMNALLSVLSMHQLGWLIFMGGFMLVSYVANSWAQSATSVPMQYAGLGLYVTAEAVIFAPLLYIASQFGDNVIPIAGILTLTVFSGLTVTVFLTRKNFSFMGPALSIAGFASLGVILCSAIFGFNLGILFVGAMIVLASGYILYYTSNVLHEYRIGQHVAASLALFASVALLFWWMVQLVMSLQSRD